MKYTFRIGPKGIRSKGETEDEREKKVRLVEKN